MRKEEEMNRQNAKMEARQAREAAKQAREVAKQAREEAKQAREVAKQAEQEARLKVCLSLFLYTRSKFPMPIHEYKGNFLPLRRRVRWRG